MLERAENSHRISLIYAENRSVTVRNRNSDLSTSNLWLLPAAASLRPRNQNINISSRQTTAIIYSVHHVMTVVDSVYVHH